jgi:hypothetical protein
LPPFGFIAPIGFAYAAHRARKRTWYASGVAWGLLAFVGLAINVPAIEDSDLDGFSSALMMTAWVGALVHALVIRREYVRRVSAARHDPVVLARKRVLERRRGQDPARNEPDVALELGVGRPEMPGAESMGLVDVNHAGASVIADVTGFDLALAERIVAARDEIGGFASAEDPGHLLELDPGLVDRLRDVSVYIPR